MSDQAYGETPLARRANRYTAMTESRRIFTNTIALTISRLTERASAVFLAFFISRMLYAQGLGIYSTATAYYNLIVVATEMGATNFLMREIAKDRSRTGRYVVHVSVMVAVMTAVVMGLARVVLPYLGYSAELSSSLYVIILATLPGTLSTLQEAVLIAHQRVVFITYTTFITAIATIGASLYLLTHGYGVMSLFVCFVLIRYLEMICYHFFIGSFVTLRWEFSPSFALSLLRDIRVFAGSSLLGGLFARPEVILLSLVRNEAQVGFYSAALRLVDLWYLVPETYMTNVFPVLSRSYQLGDGKARSIQEKSMKYLLALSLPIAVGLTMVAEPTVRLIYGPGFEPAIVPLQVLAWSLPFGCLNTVFWRTLVARGQQGAVLRMQAIVTCAKIVSGYILIISFGGLGAALTVVISLLLHNRLLSCTVTRGGTQLAPWRAGWRFLVAALMMGGAILPFSHQLPLWTVVPAAAVIYLLLVLLVKGFAVEDFTPFRRAYFVSMGEKES
jgi:O-antigen/teichoic acid export membrane protein